MGGYGSRGCAVSSNVWVGTVVVAQMGGWGTKGRGWDVSSNVSVGAVIVAQMGGGWGTKGSSRGGMIFGNHRGTGLVGAASAIHAVVVVAVLAPLLRSPTGKEITSCPQALNKNCSRTRWASLVEGSVLLVSACKVAVPNVEDPV